MNILEAVTGAGNGESVAQLAQKFGLPPQQAQAAVAALMPALANGLQRNTATPEGLSGLASALARGNHQKYLDDPATIEDEATVADGNAILGHLLGSKDASRQVATQASQSTGVDPAVLKKMLPIVAALAMAALSRKSKGQAARGGGLGGLTEMLGPLLGSGGGAAGGGLADMVGGMLRKKS